ncbi:PAS/PAC sensor signal transduction histidine kinase [Methanolobus psychrophilus R15]|nr:PAS/PAC sensor signal transduction histidine kinase [Methanolobus psychrophilus R15]
MTCSTQRGIGIPGYEVKNEEEKDFQLDLLRKVLGSVQDHIVVIDRNMRIIMSNWKHCDSVPARDKQGHPYCYSCLMKRSTPCEPCYMLEVLTTGRCRKYEIEDPLDGKTKSVELSPILDEEHNVVMVVRHTKDVSERKSVERILKMRESQHAAVASLGQQGLSDGDLDSLMKEAVRLVAQTLNVEYCRIMRQEKAGNTVMIAGVGWEEETRDSDIDAHSDDSSSILCYTLYSGEPAVVMDRETKDRFSGYSLLRGHGLVSGMDVLIGRKDRPFGTLSVHTAQSRVFTEDDIHFMQSVANVLAESINRRENEDNLHRYTRELESSTELKVLFTDILTHDLLNPANIIRGFTEELLIIEDDKDKIRLLDKVHSNNEKLIDMMESATKFIKLESVSDVKFEEQDIVPIIERAIRSVRDDIDKRGLTLVFNPVPGCVVHASPLMEEVFINLLSNAIKYSPEKEKIIVSIQDLGNEYRIQVTDFGSGISNQDKPMIFDRFKRADKGSVKGSGLGLAIVKRIIDLHKGKAGVDDNPLGRGSIFWVSLKKA